MEFASCVASNKTRSDGFSSFCCNEQSTARRLRKRDNVD